MSSIVANRLARICAYSTNAPEWAEFVRLATPVVSLAAWRAAAAWSDQSKYTANEIVQEVFLKLCEDERRVLREFEDRGDDSFLKLLRVITVSVATDYFRRMHAEKRGGSAQIVALETQTGREELPDAKATEALEWPTLVSQLDGLLLRHRDLVTRRDRTLFWLYFRQGFTAEAISQIPEMGLGRKGVESALHRLTLFLKDEMQKGKSVEETKILEKSATSNDSLKGFSRVVAINSVKPR